MAAVVASTMTKLSVTAPTPLQVHADPRSFLTSSHDNDVEGTLQEADDLTRQREATSDEEWTNTHGDLAAFIGLEEDGEP